jgi:uncharacterized membrane protein YjgN (DUF898 family)
MSQATLTDSQVEVLSTAGNESTTSVQQLTLTFTGSGREYFRIWIVNLCLTLVTFGIYSAWAKVRRLSYFDRNTQLEGSTFNFHGDPVVILRGRIVAALLLFAYHYLFGLSASFASVFTAFVFICGPWILRSAIRFRLRNTSYRGLRFNFNGSLAAAYANYLPVAIIFLTPALIAVLFRSYWITALSGLLYLLWPWLQARMKRYQHGNFSYGQKQSHSALDGFELIWPYLISAGAVLLISIFAGILLALSASGNPLRGSDNIFQLLIMLAVPILTGLIVYSLLGPFLQAKVWNETWSSTRLDNIQFVSQLPAWAYTKLQIVNTILTLLSLGLYRPFAVVRAYQFRLAHIHLQAIPEDLETNALQVNAEGAAGESAVEFIGFDLSW